MTRGYVEAAVEVVLHNNPPPVHNSWHHLTGARVLCN